MSTRLQKPSSWVVMARQLQSLPLLHRIRSSKLSTSTKMEQAATLRLRACRSFSKILGSEIQVTLWPFFSQVRWMLRTWECTHSKSLPLALRPWVWALLMISKERYLSSKMTWKTLMSSRGCTNLCTISQETKLLRIFRLKSRWIFGSYCSKVNASSFQTGSSFFALKRKIYKWSKKTHGTCS